MTKEAENTHPGGRPLESKSRLLRITWDVYFDLERGWIGRIGAILSNEFTNDHCCAEIETYSGTLVFDPIDAARAMEALAEAIKENCKV